VVCFFYDHEVLFFHENEWKKVKWVKKRLFFTHFYFFSLILLFFTHFWKTKLLAVHISGLAESQMTRIRAKNNPKYFRFTLPWTNTAYITQGLTKLFSSNYQNQNKYKNSLNYKIINWVMKFLFLIRFLASLATIKTYFLYT
jgi:hypothetical protein